MNTKDKVIKAIQELPPDASIEDAMEKYISCIRLTEASNRQIQVKKYLKGKLKSACENG